jgi:hypothetical protein
MADRKTPQDFRDAADERIIAALQWLNTAADSMHEASSINNFERRLEEHQRVLKELDNARAEIGKAEAELYQARAEEYAQRTAEDP